MVSIMCCFHSGRSLFFVLGSRILDKLLGSTELISPGCKDANAGCGIMSYSQLISISLQSNSHWLTFSNVLYTPRVAIDHGSNKLSAEGMRVALLCKQFSPPLFCVLVIYDMYGNFHHPNVLLSQNQ